MRFWGRRRNKDAEIDAEIRSHIDEAIRERVEKGESPTDARSNVMREFGNVTLVKEVTRSMWSWSLLERLGQELKFGLRGLRKSPGFSLITILTFALGIGATTAIFSVVYGVVLRPLPFGDPERLVAIWITTPERGRMPMAAAIYRDIKDQCKSLEDVAIFRASANYNLTGDGEPEWLQGSSIPSNFFPLLRVQPMLGRGFTPEENQDGNDRSVILSYALWNRRYAGDANILGKTIRLENRPFTVVGVMSPNFQYPTRDIQMWTPLTINPADFQNRGGFVHTTIARLKPTATVSQVQNELTIISSRLAEQYGGASANVRLVVAPLREDIAGATARPLVILLAASLGLLLIGCCNVANLLLTRTLSRSHETAVRNALGASRGQLLLQSVAELLPHVVSGAILGLLVARFGVQLLVRLLPTTLPRMEEIAVNLPAMLFSIALLFITSTLVMIFPLRQLQRTNLVSTLRANTRSSTAGRTRVRNVLVVAQVALTVMLLTGAGLLMRTFAALKEVNPGFQSSGILSMRLAIPRSKYKQDAKIVSFCQNILESVRALPNVEVAGMASRLPLTGASAVSAIEFERRRDDYGVLSETDDTTITPDYLPAMNIPLLRGRLFSEADNAGSPLVVIIDEQVSKRAWPGEDPIGKRLRSGRSSPWAEVIGVTRHIRSEKLETDERLQVYWNYQQRARDRMSLVIRTSGDPHSQITPVLNTIRSTDPDQPAFAIQTMSEVVDQSLSLRWFNAVIVSLFAVSSLLLAMIGIYGVIAWNVKQQTREIGVRVALGANRNALLTMVLGKGLKMTAFGIALGLVGSFLLSRFLRSLLFGITQTDPLTFGVVPLLLLLAAVLACLIPARRALKVDPMIALRYE
jgi:putative ABC transport system permease protein